MGTTTLIIYVVFFGELMYFMIFLPKRRDKKAKELMGSLQVGNSIITIGGISGKVINLKDDEVTLETSVEKTQLVVKKWAIKEVIKPIEG